MTSLLEPRSAPAWILAAGLALVGLGLVAESQDNNGGGNQTRSLPLTSAFGTADSNDRMIAVTGVDVTGASLLYLVDTEGKHISVYQANGGTSSTMNLKWIGARNIALDLQVDGFNDKSEISYKELAQRFAESGSSATTEKH